MKIKLDCSTLMLSLIDVQQLDIYLWPVEGSIPFINLIISVKLRQGLFKLILSNVPLLNVAKVFLWPS